MSEKNNNENEQDLRTIPTWTRRYAANRMLPVVVFHLFFIAGSVIIGGLSCLTVWAYISGERLLAGGAMLLLSGAFVGLAWFAFVGGHRIVRRISERLSPSEGEVSVGPAPEEVVRLIPPWVWLSLAFCIVASIGLGLLGFIPIRYMQPVSALYCVPLLCYVGAKLARGDRRRVMSPMALWPLLYAIHAIALVAGAPIYFSGVWEQLNMFIPVVGYGLIAALAAHIYSRYALRRLRALATTPETVDQSIEAGGS